MLLRLFRGCFLHMHLVGDKIIRLSSFPLFLFFLHSFPFQNFPAIRKSSKQRFFPKQSKTQLKSVLKWQESSNLVPFSSLWSPSADKDSWSFETRTTEGMLSQAASTLEQSMVVPQTL